MEYIIRTTSDYITKINVLDPKSASSTTAQLQRKRNYSDEIQRYDFPPPAKAPNWACNEQEDVARKYKNRQEDVDNLQICKLARKFVMAERFVRDL
ncbi:hypothetical protein Glove_590g39 [Diversispora epigaea]|uniref:Uncharacterized protein n=1 Tax=Diversispora epigaea TaxID=1348612 RepID=A0A397GC03_9GLOM|nr:hypothetical protein Glove_590g39 [Diversispora epigaea]